LIGELQHQPAGLVELLQLADFPADGCITKAGVVGQVWTVPGQTQRRPEALDRHRWRRCVPRRRLGGAGRQDSPLLGPTLWAATTQVGPRWPTEDTLHLDAGYDSGVTRAVLDGLCLHGAIAATTSRTDPRRHNVGC
jgi:hypothetical protein